MSKQKTLCKNDIGCYFEHMPHHRRRHALRNVQQLLTFSPLVGLLGHRQVGKTTLVSHIAKRYFTMDDATEQQAAQQHATAYVRKRSGHRIGLDECQLAPALFPALKEWVRTHPKPGQFLLSGSVRFTSRRAIRESLTGRIVTQELLPFSIGELAQEPLADGLLRILPQASLSQIHTLLSCPARVWHQRQHAIANFLERGGMPGLCMIRNPVIRHTKVAAQLQTILDRDVRLVIPTTLPYQTIHSIAVYAADHAGIPMNMSDMSRTLRVAPATLKKLLYALEGVFVLRGIPVEGSTAGMVYFFEDLAEWNSLCSRTADRFWQLAHVIYHHTRVQWAYQLEHTASFFQYRTRGGAIVPVCIRGKEGVLGLLPIHNARPNRSETATAASFLKTYARGNVLFLTEEGFDIRGDERTAIAPLAAVTV